MRTTSLASVARAAAAVSLVMIFAVRAGAQDSAEVSVGARIRWRTDSSARWQYGRFGGIVADSLLFRTRTDSVPRRVVIEALQQVAVRRADRSQRRSNTIAGAVLGVAVTALAFDLAIQHCERSDHHSEGPPCGIAWVGFPLYAMGGAFIGTIAGSRLPAYRWQPVTIIGPPS